MSAKILISPEDLAVIKQQIKNELLSEMGEPKRYNVSDFEKARDKYIKIDTGLLRKKYGNFIAHKIWEHVRSLAVTYAGCRYVRELTTEKAKKASEIIETLCEIMLSSPDWRDSDVQ